MFHTSFNRLVATASMAAVIALPIDPSAMIENMKSKISVPQIIPGEYIVLLKNDADPATVGRQHNVQPKMFMNGRMKLFAASLSQFALSELQNDPNVLSIEPDRIVEIAAQTLPTGILRADAELAPTAKIDGNDERVNVDVAVIDTGIQKNHPDLNVVGGYNCTNFLTTKWEDGNGHGTHVAGTIGAKDNASGVVGMAPGARLWAVKVLGNNGSGNLSWIICGVDWVTRNAATIEVANMSLGGTFSSPAFDAAIHNAVAAGVTITVAAGNSAADAETFSPANHPDVIAVSAIADSDGLPGGVGPDTSCYADSDDTFAGFSNFGSVVDIAAPGVCITSTWKGNAYATISGTSMASPHVAGAAALFVAKNGKPTNAAGVLNVKNALLSSAIPQGDANGFTGDPDGFAEPLLNVNGY